MRDEGGGYVGKTFYILIHMKNSKSPRGKIENFTHMYIFCGINSDICLYVELKQRIENNKQFIAITLNSPNILLISLSE